MMQLVVLAKEPLPGRVKTRLCPPCTPTEAAALAAAALRDTLSAVAATPAVRRTLVFAGNPAGWAAPNFTVLAQRGEGLDERLAAAYTDASRDCPAPVLLVGMDTPQLTPALLAAAGRLLDSAGTDAVLGPAVDGGWWALGLRRTDPALLLGVPMSTPSTGACQLERLTSAGRRVALLPTLRDVDTFADAELVAAGAPSSRFATEFARLPAFV